METGAESRPVDDSYDYEETDDYDDDEEPPPPELDEDELIDDQYEFVLDSLLFPTHVKDQLMATQTKEKKLMIIEMHKHLLENKKGTQWGDQQNSLLNLIKNSKRPDIQVLITLRSSLSTGNKDFLTGFLEADGIYVLMKCIDERIAKLPMTDLDASILYEVICCCKSVMNNNTGMEALLVTPGAIEHIAKSMFFEWKPIALVVLEILSVCCYYSEGSSTMVINGMKLLAKMRNEAPFQCLCQALIYEDIEVKAAVAQFVNSMVMGMDNIQDRNFLRAELSTQLYIETYEEVLRNVRLDVERVETTTDEHIIVDSMMGNRRTPQVTATTGLIEVGNGVRIEGGNDLAGYIQVGKGKHAVAVNPNEGTMAGVCITVMKEQRKFNLLGKQDKIKVQPVWFELDGNTLKCGTTKEKDINDLKPLVSMSNVVFIRDYTTDSTLAKEVRFTLEIETTDDVIALGCENAFDKDCWITALTVARDVAVMKRSAYRLVSKDLSIEEFRNHAQMYIKQGTIYFSMLTDDRELVITSYGLNTSDPLMLAEFLYHEMVAMGISDKYHELVQLLILMPPGTPKLWDFLNDGVKRLISCSITEDEDMIDAFHIDMNTLVSLLENKAEEMGSIYPQVSKLAMSVMNKETEIRQLRLEIDSSMNIIERIKNDLQEGFEAIDLKLNDYKNGNELRTLLRSLLDLPDRLLLDDHTAAAAGTATTTLATGAGTKKRRSSITETKYEIYTRMLKALPDAYVVKEKMIADGISENEILDFFGIELAMSLPMKGDGKGGSLLGIHEAKIKKLLKMLPSVLVREKMIEAGFDDKEIEYLLSAESKSPRESSSIPTIIKPIDPKYEKYFKMMKMLPEGAVRQKMTQDGFKPDDIEDFFKQLLNIAVATASGATISPVQLTIDPKYEKYCKMMKMLPEGAVRQKMMQEGMSAADIDEFFNKVWPAFQAGGTTTTATAVTPAVPTIDPKFEKYAKMMKMLPEGAVRNKMVQDGFPEKDSDEFFNKAWPAFKAASAAGGGASTDTGGGGGGGGSSVTPDQKFEKYNKMLKMLPEGAVRNKMVQDGLTQDDINGFFNKGSGGGGGGGGPGGPGGGGGGFKKTDKAAEGPPPGMKAKPIVNPPKKMKGLFWTKLKNDEVIGTVWEEINEFDYPKNSKEIIEILFSAVIRQGIEKDAEKEAELKDKKAKAGISLFDSKRVQGVLIFLGRVRKTPKEVVRLIIELNPKVMTQVLTETILNICPTVEELNTVKAFETPHTLDLTGQLFYEMSLVPRLEQRLRSHEIAFKWDNDATEANNHLSIFLKASMEIRRSKPQIMQLFSMILSLGNYLNGGTPRGQAYGIKLDFMAKLSTIKMNPIAKKEGTNTLSILCGPTVLHFLAFQAEETNKELLEMSSTWESLWLASEIPYQQLEMDIKQLDTQITKIKEELTIGVPVVLQEKGPDMAEPLKKRLTQFLSKAETRMTGIKTNLSDTTETVKKTMAIFGEKVSNTSEEDVISSFFITVSTFVKAFNQAIQDNAKLREDQDKLTRKQAEATRLKEHRAARAATLAKNDGIFADFKKNQSRQADEILNRHRTDRRPNVIKDTTTTTTTTAAANAMNSSTNNISNLTLNTPASTTTGTTAAHNKSSNSIFANLAKAGSSIANTFSSTASVLSPVHEPNGERRVRGRRRRPSLVKEK